MSTFDVLLLLVSDTSDDEEDEGGDEGVDGDDDGDVVFCPVPCSYCPKLMAGYSTCTDLCFNRVNVFMNTDRVN